MTQIVDISGQDWYFELYKTCQKFEKEYGVTPHMYINSDFKQRSVGFFNNVTWIATEDKMGTNNGLFNGYSFELDDVIEPGVALLKG